MACMVCALGQVTFFAMNLIMICVNISQNLISLYFQNRMRCGKIIN
jgi:hypothetical protein